MSWEHVIAKTIKGERNHSAPFYIAEVVQTNPTKLSILGGQIFITDDEIIKTETFAKIEALPEDDPQALKKGQRVAILGAKSPLVIGRVVE